FSVAVSRPSRALLFFPTRRSSDLNLSGYSIYGTPVSAVVAPGGGYFHRPVCIATCKCVVFYFHYYRIRYVVHAGDHYRRGGIVAALNSRRLDAIPVLVSDTGHNLS